MDPEKQAARHCTLPTVDTNTWDEHATLESVHMGAPPAYDREGEDPEWQRPAEPIDENGCPCGYIYSAFVLSLLDYRRQMDNNGNRIDHHRYTRCKNDLVIEALRAMELEEAAADSDRYKIMNGG